MMGVAGLVSQFEISHLWLPVASALYFPADIAAIAAFALKVGRPEIYRPKSSSSREFG
jgi:hypothetical protein